MNPNRNPGRPEPCASPGPGRPGGLEAARGRRPRILFVGEAICLAHVGRPALLARWAQEAGYEVAFACGGEYAHIPQAEGLSTRPLLTFRQEHLERLRQGRFFYSLEQLERYVKAEGSLIREVRPDLVVGDWRLSLQVSAALEGVRMLQMVNAQWSPAHPCRMPAPRAGIWRRLPLGLREICFRMVLPLGYRYFGGPLNALRRRHGLGPLNDLRELYTAGDYCAYLDIPELLPLPRMPEGHFYLGPLAWKPSVLPVPNLEALEAGRPLAYVSMGSSGDEALLPQVALALMELGFNAVFSGLDPGALAGWLGTDPASSGRRWAARLVDPDRVLPGATLTICHAGSGTVYQSLGWGVPLLCLPDNPDQGLIAQAVRASGAGLSLHPDRVCVDRLKRILTARFLESPALRERARGLSRSLAMWDTRERWLNWLGSLWGGARPSRVPLPDSGSPGEPRAAALRSFSV